MGRLLLMMLLPLSSPFKAHSGGLIPLLSHRAAHDCCAATASPHAATPHDAAARLMVVNEGTSTSESVVCCVVKTNVFFVPRQVLGLTSVAVVGDSLGFSLGL